MERLYNSNGYKGLGKGRGRVRTHIQKTGKTHRSLQKPGKKNKKGRPAPPSERAEKKKKNHRIQGLIPVRKGKRGES